MISHCFSLSWELEKFNFLQFFTLKVFTSFAKAFRSLEWDLVMEAVLLLHSFMVGSDSPLVLDVSIPWIKVSAQSEDNLVREILADNGFIGMSTLSSANVIQWDLRLPDVPLSLLSALPTWVRFIARSLKQEATLVEKCNPGVKSVGSKRKKTYLNGVSLLILPEREDVNSPGTNQPLCVIRLFSSKAFPNRVDIAGRE